MPKVARLIYLFLLLAAAGAVAVFALFFPPPMRYIIWVGLAITVFLRYYGR